jgi:hypothetical protein
MGIYTPHRDQGPQKPFPLAPPGPQQVVFCDVEPLGMKPISYQGRTRMMSRVALYFLSEWKDDDGKPIPLRQEFTDSFYETARLRKFLESWRGAKMTDAECKSFDPEKLIGVNATVSVIHHVTPQRTYANIDSIMPFRGTPMAVPSDFVRKKDRIKPERDVRYPVTDRDGADPDPENDLPF